MKTDENENEYKIQCDVERRTGTSKKTGQDYNFLVFKAWNKRGRRVDLKLLRECEGQPKKEGCYYLTIEKGDIKPDKRSRFEAYYVRKVKSFEEYDGFKATDNEDLPF